MKMQLRERYLVTVLRTGQIRSSFCKVHSRNYTASTPQAFAEAPLDPPFSLLPTTPHQKIIKNLKEGCLTADIRAAKGDPSNSYWCTTG